MPFRVLPVNYDLDMERIATLEIASWPPSSKDMRDTLFPPNPSKSTSQKDEIESEISRMSSDREHLSTKLMKLIDTDLAQNPETDPSAIIAFARWKLYTSDRVDDIKYPKREDLPAIFGAGCNAEAVKAFFGGIYGARERLYGKQEYAHLAGIYCDPLHQKRGAGSLLMKWGCAEADSLGLKAFLEASPYGLSLYRKFGFEEIETFHFDPSKYGGQATDHAVVVMCRAKAEA